MPLWRGENTKLKGRSVPQNEVSLGWRNDGPTPGSLTGLLVPVLLEDSMPTAQTLCFGTRDLSTSEPSASHGPLLHTVAALPT